jgi:hypothetical protein
MQEGIASFLVGQLRVNTKTRTYGVGLPHRFRASNVKRLWKLLAGHGPDMDITVQT